MSSLKEHLGPVPYLELMAAGPPAVTFDGALSLMDGARSAWVLAPRLAALPALSPETLLVCAPSIKQAYWATEQALKSGALDAVALVLDGAYDLTQSRRFKLAIEAKGTRLIVILPGSIGPFNSAAQERWHMAPSLSPHPQSRRSHGRQIKNKREPLSEMDILSPKRPQPCTA